MTRGVVVGLIACVAAVLVGAVAWMLFFSRDQDQSGVLRAAFMVSAPSSSVIDLAFDARRRVAVISSRDGIVVSRSLDRPGHVEFVRAPLREEDRRQHYPIALSSDGRVLALGAPREINPETGQPSCNTARIYFYKRQGGEWRAYAAFDDVPVNTRALAFSPDGSMMAAGMGAGLGVVVYRTPQPGDRRGIAFEAGNSARVWRSHDNGLNPCSMNEDRADEHASVYEVRFAVRGEGEHRGMVLLAFIYGEAGSREPDPQLHLVTFENGRPIAETMLDSGHERASIGGVPLGWDPYALALSPDGARLAIAGKGEGADCANTRTAAAPIVEVLDVDAALAGRRAVLARLDFLTPSASGSEPTVIPRYASIHSLVFDASGTVTAGGALVSCPEFAGVAPLAHPEVYAQGDRREDPLPALVSGHGVLARWPRAEGGGYATVHRADIGYSQVRAIVHGGSEGRSVVLRGDGDVFEVDYSQRPRDLAYARAAGYVFVNPISPSRMAGPCTGDCASAWAGLDIREDGATLQWLTGISPDSPRAELSLSTTGLRVGEIGGGAPSLLFRDVVRVCRPGLEGAQCASADSDEDAARVVVVGPGADAVDTATAALAPAVRARIFPFDNRRDRYRVMAISPSWEQLFVGSVRFLRAFDLDGRQQWCRAAPAEVNRIIADDERVLTAGGDGVLRWYRASDGTLIASAFMERGGRRAVVWRADSSAYAATGGGGDALAVWLRGDDTRAPHRFSLAQAEGLHDPDAVLRAIRDPETVAPPSDVDPQTCVAETAPAPAHAAQHVAVRLRLDGREPDNAGVYEVDARSIRLRAEVEPIGGATAPNRVRLQFEGVEGDPHFVPLRGGAGSLVLQMPYPSLRRGRVYTLRYGLGQTGDAALPEDRSLSIRWTGADVGDRPRRRLVAVLVGAARPVHAATISVEREDAETRSLIDQSLHSLRGLQGPGRDVRGWLDYLERVRQGAEFDELCIGVLSDDPSAGHAPAQSCPSAPQTATCLGRSARPTRGALETCLTELSQLDLSMDDVVVFVFAGHGATLARRLNATGARFNQLLVLNDDIVFVSEVARELARSPAAKVIVLDACRTEYGDGEIGGLNDLEAERDLRIQLQGSAFVIAQGAPYGALAADTPSGGAFTMALLTALENRIPYAPGGRTDQQVQWIHSGGRIDFSQLRDRVGSGRCSSLSLLDLVEGGDAFRQAPRFAPETMAEGQIALEVARGRGRVPADHAPLLGCRRIGGGL
jgi:hypothetical protein